VNYPIIGDSIYHMWDVRLVIDMFLGGAGMGVFVLAILASFSLGWERTTLLRKVAGVFAPVALAVSLLLLASELSQPGRFYLPFLMGQASSPLEWGTWIQMGFLLISAVFGLGALGWVRLSEIVMKTLGVIGAVLGAAVAIYHGVYLADNISRPLWAIGGVPFLFTIISLATGAAVLVLAAAIAGSRELAESTRGQPQVMVGAALAVLVGTALYLWALATTGSEAQEGAALLISGSFAVATWVGVFALGALGVAFGWIGLRGGVAAGPSGATLTMALPALAALLILTSGFILRYIIVIGGQTIPQLPVT